MPALYDANNANRADCRSESKNCSRARAFRCWSESARRTAVFGIIDICCDLAQLILFARIHSYAAA